MFKKYEGGWGIRVRKNVKLVDSNKIWLNDDNELTTANNAKRYDTREEAYLTVNNNMGFVEIEIGDNVIDCNNFAVDKLPVKLVNPNPDRPWDIIFDRIPPCEYVGDMQYDKPDHVVPSFTYKKIDSKSKEGKQLLELICKLFGI